MPALPPFAPWIKPADEAGHFMQAYQASAQIAEAQARMQQQAQKTQIELGARKAQNDRQYQVEQQRMEIEKSYHQQQMALGQQKLQEASQINQLKIQQAAQTLQAQGQYNQDYQAFLDQGMSEGDASIKAALKNPGFLKGGSGLAAVSRAAQASVPKNLEINKQAEGTFYRSSPTEQYHIVPGGSEDKVMEHQPVISAFASLRKAESDYSAADDKTKPKIAADIEDKQRKINRYYKSKNKGLPFPDVAESAALPMPKAKADLKAGQIYQTKRGPARWDGDKFTLE